MRRLVLVKHSLPTITDDVESAEWPLSAEGARRCGPLAEALVDYLPASLSTSAEPKARTTAELVGARLGLVPVIVPGLHEHDRRGTPLLGQEAFQDAVARFFAQPDAPVYGNESASEALTRFRAALDGVLARQPGENAIVVTHGTVLTLYVASHGGDEPFALWRRLQCPSFVVLEVPGMRIVHQQF